MTGKTTKAVMAIFAVALMMMVAFVPAISVLTDDGSDGATDTVFSDIDVQLFTSTSDLSKLVYYNYGQDHTAANNKVPTGMQQNDYTAVQDASTGNYYFRNNATGNLLTYGDIPAYKSLVVPNYLPKIQITATYKQANVDKIDATFTINHAALATPYKFISSNINSADGYGTVTGTKMTMLSVSLTASEDLNIAPALQAGDYTVKIDAAQGVNTQTVTKTVSNGTAITVSGIVKDAGSNPVSNITVTPTVTAGTGSVSPSAVTTGADGKYSFAVTSGAVVSVALTGLNYSFAESSYSFGTVTASAVKDFTAKESTAKITINDANNQIVKDSTSVSFTVAWYAQKASTTSGKYNIYAAADGSAVLVGVSSGIATIVYTVPTKVAETTMYLVADASTNGEYYTFDREVITTGDAVDKPIATQVSDKDGLTVVSSNSGTVKATEKTGVITKTDSGSNPAFDAGVSLQWYSQLDNGAAATPRYTITTTSDGSGKVITSSAGVNGTIYYSYKAPATVPNTVFVLVANGSAGGIYTFTNVSFVNGADTIATQLSKVTGSADATNGTATVKANEKTFKISGNIEGTTVAGTISYNDGAAKTAIVDKTGNFVFYVKEKSVVTIAAISDYTPSAGYALGTVTADKTANYTKVVTPVGTQTLNYKVTGVGTAKVTFAYTVDGSKYTSAVTPTDGVATLTFNAKVGAAVTVSATAEGYTIPAFDGYTAAAYTTSKMYFVMYDSDVTTTDKVAPNFKVDYTATQNSKEVKGTLTADKNGVATIDVKNTEPMSGFTFSYGIFKVTGTPSTTTDVQYAFGDYTKLDVTNFNVAEGKGVEVTVSYQAANNQYSVPSYADIAEDQKLFVKYGATVTLTAPSYNGFDFKCWMIDGVSVGDKNTYVYTAPASAADASSSSVYIDALYGATQTYNGTPAGINSTVLIIGIIAVVIALIAVAYVVIQTKKKD